MSCTLKYGFVLLATALLHLPGKVVAQDPNFSQYHSSPMNINPALTSHGETNLRVLSNFRTQSIGIGASYNTLALSLDGKLKADEDYSSFLSSGGMIIQENAMGGAYKNTFVNGNLAYHLTLDEKGNGLSLGLGFIYDNTRIDLSKLSFDNQLTSSGFNTVIPPGELFASNSNTSFSACAGLMYTFSNEDFYFNLGGAGYRFIRTRNSILNDNAQYINPRYDLHANYGQNISDRANIDLSVLHVMKGGSSVTSLGALLSRRTGAEDYTTDAQHYLNLGLYYRSTGALIPYIGYEWGDLQLGATYDISVSGFSGAAITPKTFELSLSWKHFANAMKLKFGKFHSPL